MLRFLCIAVVLTLSAPGFAADIVGKLRVVDGDTLVINDTRVRLYGVDAPERDQPCTTLSGQPWSCGDWVTQQVRARFDGAVARCTVEDTDRYGRVVAICHAAGQEIGDVLVSEGWAYAYRRYSMRYDLQEKAAYVADRGIHGYVLQSPARYRMMQRAGQSNPAGDCQIKGNINREGVRIYHMPGQKFYARTGINEAKGERWFCSEAQARASGWRAARR
jgi:endonuclease YncB( thermonuclease family)